MYTQFDKSLIAAVMGVVALLALFFKGIDLTSAAGILQVIVPVLTPILVHLFPNIPQDPPTPPVANT